MPHTKTITYNKTPIKIIIRSDADDSVFNEIFVEREYKNVEPVIKNAKTQIIDIGGHTGMFAIYARILNPNVPIVTFEPENQNYKHLKENLKLNHIKNIKTKNLAVSNKEGQTALFLSEDSHNHSLTKKSEKTQITQTTTLEKIITKQTDLVKMDCEGAEFEIIEKTPLKTLRLIKNLYIEYHTKDPKLITTKLQKAGFRAEISHSHYDSSMGIIQAYES